MQVKAKATATVADQSPHRPELRATATMLVAEHGGVAHSLAGWQIAVVVLRYFVAVLMLGEWVRTGPAPGSWTRVMRLLLRTTFSVPRKLSPRTWCAIRRAFSF